MSDALRGHEALLRDLAARGDPGLAEALEKAAADGFTEDEAVTLAQASKGLLDALASGRRRDGRRGHRGRGLPRRLPRSHKRKTEAGST